MDRNSYEFPRSTSYSTGAVGSERRSTDANSLPRFRFPTTESEENSASFDDAATSNGSAGVLTSVAPMKSVPARTEKSVKLIIDDGVVVRKRIAGDAVSAQTIPPSTIGALDLEPSVENGIGDDGVDTRSSVPVLDDSAPLRRSEDNQTGFAGVPTLRSASSMSFDVPIRTRYADTSRSFLQTFEEERATLAMIEMDRPHGLTEDNGLDNDDEEGVETEGAQVLEGLDKIVSSSEIGSRIATTSSDEEVDLENGSGDDNASLDAIYDYPDNPYESLTTPFSPWRELPQHPIEALGPSYSAAAVLRGARKKFVAELKNTKQSYRISSIKSTFSMLHKFKHNFAVRKFDEKSRDKLNKYKAIRKGDWVRYKALHAATLLG
ncbi:hypothetical protein HDU93_000977 [Gonapodya sp. JEL0774]|nr:hypothetical protein HDU93_000977 [Gonapodya sp. JEL0774]